ncbi:hypothetical protein [Niallia circulans]|nr:hypothetical protein [Niallia circulans]
MNYKNDLISIYQMFGSCFVLRFAIVTKKSRMEMSVALNYAAMIYR